MKKGFSITIGLLFITVGIILCLNLTGITNIDIFFDGWWTLFIIVPSISSIITSKEKASGLVGLIAGVLLLLAARDIIEYSVIWKFLLPTALIIIGLAIIFKVIFRGKIEDKIKEINSNNTDSKSCTAVFSGQDIKIKDKFEGATYTAIFGGIEVDLRDAKIKEDVVINTTSVFGGIEITAPYDVKVVVSSNSIFGGVEDNRKIKNEEKDTKVIYINATCVFGGIDIK